MGVRPVASHEPTSLIRGVGNIIGYVVTHQDTDMVVLNLTIELVGRFKQDAAALFNFFGSGTGYEPAVAYPSNAPGSRRRASSDPNWR